MKKRKITKAAKFIVPGSIVLLLLCNYCGSNTGTITIVNPTLKSQKVKFLGKDIILESEQHFTQKGLKPGRYEIKTGAEAPLAVEISKQRTTLFDIGGDNCFIVADYTDQYGEEGGGTVKIVEKFANQKSFTPFHKITAQLGEHLPQNVQGNDKITRIHRVDCNWIENNQAIIDAIANLP